MDHAILNHKLSFSQTITVQCALRIMREGGPTTLEEACIIISAAAFLGMTEEDFKDPKYDE